MIHVCFGLHDKTGKYSKFTGTAIVSIFENTSTPPHEITVHILHDNTLSDGNRKKFLQLAERYEQQINFYNVEEICPEKISEIRNLIPAVESSKLTTGAFYRLTAPDAIPDDIKKIIYLDSDTIINLDINELWKIELGDKPLAAACESECSGIPAKLYLSLCREGIVKDEDYFNSGVMVMNLEVFRNETEKINQGIKFRAARPNETSMDQFVLNYCFANDAIKRPKNFNVMVVHARNRKDFSVENKICHYISGFKGVGVTPDLKDKFNKLWFKYFTKTDWFNVEIIGNISESVRNLYVEQKNFATAVSSIISGKTRAFFTTPENIENLKKVFYIRDDEEIIPYESPESLKKLAKSIKKSHGKKFFLILSPDYVKIGAELQNAGFKEGKHFGNAADFLSDAHGFPLNTYFLVQAM